MTREYPLERVARLRAHRASDAAIDLGAAQRALGEAEAALARAIAARDQARAAAAAVRLCDGEAAAIWAISRREAFAERRRRDVHRAGARVAACEREVEAWRGRVEIERAKVVATRAEREVLARHRARWDEETRRTKERREG